MYLILLFLFLKTITGNQFVGTLCWAYVYEPVDDDFSNERCAEMFHGNYSKIHTLEASIVLPCEGCNEAPTLYVVFAENGVVANFTGGLIGSENNNPDDDWGDDFYRNKGANYVFAYSWINEVDPPNDDGYITSPDVFLIFYGNNNTNHNYNNNNNNIGLKSGRSVANSMLLCGTRNGVPMGKCCKTKKESYGDDQSGIGICQTGLYQYSYQFSNDARPAIYQIGVGYTAPAKYNLGLVTVNSFWNGTHYIARTGTLVPGGNSTGDMFLTAMPI